jgi:ferredoxin-NADP reductase
LLQKKYKSRIISINNHFEGIYTLEFESLNGNFKYHPGQFLHLALDTDYDGSGQWPDSRCFSMQSSPDEELIKITYAIKGHFTNRMKKELEPGKLVTLKLPYGDLFSQVHNKVNTVFIAGGTGITPFLSLFTHQSFRQYTNPHIYLGFRSKEYNIYNEEMVRSYNSSKYLKYFYENTEGVIDINSIYDENGKSCDYFISGPPVMIKAFKQVLIDKGVPVNQILTDLWS